jgi:hypothetical protein
MYRVGGRERTATEEREVTEYVEHLPVYLIVGSKSCCPPWIQATEMPYKLNRKTFRMCWQKDINSEGNVTARL